MIYAFAVLTFIGNLKTDSNGTVNIDITDKHLTLIGPHSILGRTVVVRSCFDLSLGSHL